MIYLSTCRRIRYRVSARSRFFNAGCLCAEKKKRCLRGTKMNCRADGAGGTKAGPVINSSSTFILISRFYRIVLLGSSFSVSGTLANGRIVSRLKRQNALCEDRVDVGRRWKTNSYPFYSRSKCVFNYRLNARLDGTTDGFGKKNPIERRFQN